jgi:hypothetical protein
MSTILNYELSPNPGTIFGCLLPAPWLGAAAGLLLAFGPGEGFPDRFSGLSLSLVHCLVLGMLAPVMIGALMQMLPVVAGLQVHGSRYIAPFVALGSATIAVGLSVGFLLHEKSGFIVAMLVAFILYGAVLLALLLAAWKIKVVDATTRSFFFAPLAFLTVVLLGIALAGVFAGWWSIDMPHFLDLHVAWGVLGWIGCLVLGVASTVVPMFWQTARPNRLWQRSLPWVFWLPLLGMSVATHTILSQLFVHLACALLAGFSAVAFVCVWRAKRHFDPAWPLWLVCAASWFCAAALTSVSLSFPNTISPFFAAMFPWWIGGFALVGGAVFPVNAMLGKIIPFLIFVHLRRQIPLGIRVPTMQAVLPPQRLKWQALLLCLSLFLLLLIPLSPHALRPFAGISVALSQAMLGYFLLASLFRYRHELRARLFSERP